MKLAELNTNKTELNRSKNPSEVKNKVEGKELNLQNLVLEYAFQGLKLAIISTPVIVSCFSKGGDPKKDFLTKILDLFQTSRFYERLLKISPRDKFIILNHFQAF